MTADRKSIFAISTLILLLTFTITALVPYQGDDVWLNYYHHQGLSFALAFFKWSYLHHVSRPGDFIAMLLGDDLKLFYSTFAALFTLSAVLVIFTLATGRIPYYGNKSSDGFILLSIFLALFLFKNSTGINQAIFSLAPGVSQMIAVIPASLLIPYFFLLRGGSLPKDNLKTNFFFLWWGLLAGFTVEYAPPAVASTIILCLLINAFIYKKKIPIWCFTGLISLIIGWSLIILAPGPYERAQAQIPLYFYHIPLSVKFLQSFWITAKGICTIRKLPLLLAIVLLLLAYVRKQKNLIIPILLIMTCWLTDQAYVFGLGKFSVTDVRFSGNIFLFAALFNLAEPYLNFHQKNIKFLLLVCSLIFFKLIYGAYVFHLQADYQNNIIKVAHLPSSKISHFLGTYRPQNQPKIIIPSFSGINPLLLKKDRVCVSFVRLCIFGLPANSINIMKAPEFFFTKFANYTSYLHAVPLSKLPSNTIKGPSKIISTARWLSVSLPYYSGYYGLHLQGILFIKKNSSENSQNLSIYRDYQRGPLWIRFLNFIMPAHDLNTSKLTIIDHPNIIAYPIISAYDLSKKFSLVIHTPAKLTCNPCQDSEQSPPQ